MFMAAHSRADAFTGLRTKANFLALIGLIRIFLAFPGAEATNFGICIFFLARLHLAGFCFLAAARTFAFASFASDRFSSSDCWNAS
jgi:hypothetical protein